MEEIISYIILVNLWLITGILFYKGYVRKRFGFQFKRYFLLGLSLLPIFLCAIKIPFQNGISIQHAISEVTVGLSNQANIASGNHFSWLELLAVFYGIGVFIALLRRLIACLLLLRKYSKSNGKEEYIEVPQSNAAFSFMGQIYLGADLNEKEKAVILEHEKIHVKQLHFIDLLLSQILEIAYFFNPFVYQLSPMMHENHELEADQVGQENSTTYLNILLQQHFQTDQSFVRLTHSFNTHHLKHRIMNLKSNKNNYSNRSGILVASIFFLSLFSLSQFIQADPFTIKTEKYQEQENKKHPEYPGGNEALMNFLIDNIKYPESAKNEGVSGTVYLKLSIAEDGNVDDIQLMKKIDERLVNEAMRVIRMMPKWEPAMKDGKAVKGEVTLPIRYNLPPEPPKPPKPPKAPEAPKAP